MKRMARWNILPFFVLGLMPGLSRAGSVSYTTLDVSGATLTNAYGINNSGQIVGSFNDSSGSHGFLKNGSTYTPFDYPGATSTTAYGINDSGQIVGTAAISGVLHGFLKVG
jgi:probable HAF family extracellular repeat protein